MLTQQQNPAQFIIFSNFEQTPGFVTGNRFSIDLSHTPVKQQGNPDGKRRSAEVFGDRTVEQMGFAKVPVSRTVGKMISAEVLVQKTFGKMMFAKVPGGWTVEKMELAEVLGSTTVEKMMFAEVPSDRTLRKTGTGPVQLLPACC